METISELRSAYKGYKDRLEKLFVLMELEKKSVRLKSIDDELSQPEIWNDREKAQALNKEATMLRRLIEGWKKTMSKVEDGVAMCELIETENDSSMLPEAIAEAVTVSKLVDDMEFKRMLGGE